MKKVNLVTLRHTYAPEEGLGHVFLPSIETTVAAVMETGNLKVDWFDENFSNFVPNKNTKTVAVSIVGAPQIPDAITFMERIRSQVKHEVEFVVGGQVTDYFTDEEFHHLFGAKTVRGEQFFKENGIKPGDEMKVSLQKVYSKVPDERMKQYLSNPFSLYLSQGCKYACTFCAAVRTKKGLKITEQFREIDTFASDLEYLVERAKEFRIHEFDIYISNLDAFQSPREMEKFAGAVLEVMKKNPKFKLQFRCLATIESVMNLCGNSPEIARKLRQIGLKNVGLGVDGVTVEVWKKTGKGQNVSGKNKAGKKYEATEKVRVAFDLLQEFEFRPEVLMVFGHQEVDTEETMYQGLQFVKTLVEEYDAVPRPHVSKNPVPGNSAWDNQKYKHIRENLIHNPELFQALDFTGEASPLTHQDSEFRELVNRYYQEMCEIPQSITPKVSVLEHEFEKKSNSIFSSKDAMKKVKLKNSGLYDI